MTSNSEPSVTPDWARVSSSWSSRSSLVAARPGCACGTTSITRTVGDFKFSAINVFRAATVIPPSTSRSLRLPALSMVLLMMILNPPFMVLPRRTRRWVGLRLRRAERSLRPPFLVVERIIAWVCNCTTFFLCSVSLVGISTHVFAGAGKRIHNENDEHA